IDQKLALALQKRSVNAVAIVCYRVGCGNVHCELAAEGIQLFTIALGLQRHENADLAEPLADLIVHVGRDDPLLHYQALAAPQGHILANGGDELGQFLADSTPGSGIVGLRERFQSAPLLQSQPCRLRYELLELLVTRDEVRFSIDFDDSSTGAFSSDPNQTFSGGTPCLLGGGSQPLLAQPVNRSFHVTLIFGQGLLTIHHARAGLLAQFLHQCGGDFSHGCTYSVLSGPSRGRGAAAGVLARSALGRKSCFPTQGPRPHQKDEVPEQIMRGRSSPLPSCSGLLFFSSRREPLRSRQLLAQPCRPHRWPRPRRWNLQLAKRPLPPPEPPAAYRLADPPQHRYPRRERSA